MNFCHTLMFSKQNVSEYLNKLFQVAVSTKFNKLLLIQIALITITTTHKEE